MNKFFLPTSRTVLPIFQTFCPDGVYFAQTAVHFAHFQNQAKKRGVLGWGCGLFLVCTYPRKGFVTAEWRTGVGGGILGKKCRKMRPHLGKMRYIWANCTKSGQKCSRIGQKKFNHFNQAMEYKLSSQVPFSDSVSSEFRNGGEVFWDLFFKGFNHIIGGSILKWVDLKYAQLV